MGDIPPLVDNISASIRKVSRLEPNSLGFL